MEVKENKLEAKTYKNAMELLVAEEIEEQIEQHYPEFKNKLNRNDIAAYALNRLPALYATSEEGLYRQKKLGKKDFQNQISAVVQQALKITQNNPLRFSTPLPSAEDPKNQEAVAALQELADWLLLSPTKVSWRDLIKEVQQVLSQIVDEKILEEQLQEINKLEIDSY